METGERQPEVSREGRRDEEVKCQGVFQGSGNNHDMVADM